MSPSCCSSGNGASHVSTNFSDLAEKMTSSLWVNGPELVMSYATDIVVQKRILGALILIISYLRLMSLQKKGPLFRVQGYPIIGNLMTFMPGRSTFINITKLVKNHGKLLELFVFKHRIIIVADVAIARECLVKRPKSFRRTEALELPAKLFGFKKGVMFAEGKDWARLRRLTAPAFSHKNVELMSDAISKEIDVFIARLKLLKSDEIVPMDLQNFFYTTGVITSVAFGDIPEEYRSLFHAVTLTKDVASIFAYMVERTLFPFHDLLWRFSSNYHTQQKADDANKRIEKQFLTLITNARLAATTATPTATDTNANTETNTHSKTGTKTVTDTALKSPSNTDHSSNNNNIDITNATNDPTTTTTTTTTTGISHSRKSLLDSLLGTTTSTEAPLTDSEIMSNVKVFYLAGSDTTAAALTWCIYSLCTHEGVYKALQEEVDSVLSVTVTGFEATAAVSSLPLCSAVLKESLRLYSPIEAVLLSLAGSQSITLSNGIEINSGDEVYVYTDSIMKNPDIFIQPNTFNPTRWYEENTTKERLSDMEDAFLVFGYGPRVCPGQALVQSEGVAALAALVRCFDFKLACPPAEIERVTDFVTKANKLPVYLTPRL